MATTATQIINIVTLNKSTLHWMVSRIVQDSINFYYFWDEYYINAYGITEEKANEQLEMYLSFNIYIKISTRHSNVSYQISDGRMYRP